MPAYIKALLIDPFKREITEVTIKPKLEDYYKTIDCTTISMIPLEEDVLILDDEGLLLDAEFQAYFSFRGYPQSYFAGKALLVGDDDADETDVSMDIEYLKRLVKWKEAPTNDEMDNLFKVEVTSWE